MKFSLIMPNYNGEETILRALNSMPQSQDIQLILLDDGSTDDSWKIMIEWWAKNGENYNHSSTIHRWEKNRGVAVTMNLGFELAEGEYIISLSSDDYFVIDFYHFMPYLDGKNDLVYFDLVVNDGSTWHVDEKSKQQYVGAVKFIRRKFLGDTRIPDLKWHEDEPFSEKLYAKNPKEVFTGIPLKRYNWPREGSLSWQANNK
jgi:glycosyltransferase involved in cell wall biosynthesis